MRMLRVRHRRFTLYGLGLLILCAIGVLAPVYQFGSSTTSRAGRSATTATSGAANGSGSAHAGAPFQRGTVGARAVDREGAEGQSILGPDSLTAFVHDRLGLRMLGRHSQALAVIHEKQGGGEASGDIVTGPSQEAYDNRAYPRTGVDNAQVVAAARASRAIVQPAGSVAAAGVSAADTSQWTPLGPVVGTVPGPVTYTGRASTVSGRITALALAATCVPGNCRLWLGAAGGGVWRTADALADQPTWTSSSQGLDSNAIGSLLIDPTDTTGNTLYAGTGEPNGSSDSEAGVGLYKSTDGGATWAVVPGSVSVAKDRSIAGIAVDPIDAQHLYIGTAVARHGASSSNGGRFTPPTAPQVGLYESKDGGSTFSLVFSQPADVVAPGTANGSDFFRGGVSQLALDRTGLTAAQSARVFVALFDYGLYRSSPADEAGDASFKQIFTSAGAGTAGNSAGARTTFALAPRDNSSLRAYVADTDGTHPANLYRADAVSATASMLTSGTTNTGWLDLSSSTKGTPGYASYNFCETQCNYDMFVASPPGHPDTVWLGGSMAYNEIFTANPPSNGRAVQRSTDAGVDFTDMTNDAQSSPVGMHPDQHAIAFAPSNPDIAFVGSDGGLVRTSGVFTDTSGQCDMRGLSGGDLTDCRAWLSAVPTTITSLNSGLNTLQFQSVTANPQDPTGDLLGGTQDNGTWAYTGTASAWSETVGGDGGQSGIDPITPSVRVHSYYNPQHDVNFNKDDPLGWDWISDPLLGSGEQASFYTPLIADPRVGGSLFDGLGHVWRTTDDGGSQAHLDSVCNEFLPASQFDPNGMSCGDWVPLGSDSLVSTTAAYGTDKSGSYVVALTRAPSDTSTLWAGTRRGRVFVSSNIDAATPMSVTFTRIDTAAQPNRFVSGISVDRYDASHAFVSFSGYNAYTPQTTGHVFEVRYNPATGTATWTDRSYNLGDQPVTGVAYDDATGDLYASTDFSVLRLPAGQTAWVAAASGLPTVATYGLTIVPSTRVLYAATHGRGIWSLTLAAATMTPTVTTTPGTVIATATMSATSTGTVNGTTTAVASPSTTATTAVASPSTTATTAPSATATASPSTTSTATASPSATNTATNSPTNTATNSPTNTPTNTATNTATSTAVPATSTATSVPATATGFPTIIPAPTATATATAMATAAATKTPTPRPTAKACHFRLALVYARAIPRHRNHTKGRPVAIVEGLNSADSRHRSPYSQTPLFFDDNRGTILFSYKAYRALACGTPRSGKHKYPYTVVDVSGTINHGQGIVRHRKVNLHNTSFHVRITATGANQYTLRVDIPRLPTYPQTFTGLQGVIDTRR